MNMCKHIQKTLLKRRKCWALGVPHEQGRLLRTVCNYEESGLSESSIETKVLSCHFDKRLFCWIEKDISFHNQVVAGSRSQCWWCIVWCFLWCVVWCFLWCVVLCAVWCFLWCVMWCVLVFWWDNSEVQSKKWWLEL